jgi:hypothetical protein
MHILLAVLIVLIPSEFSYLAGPTVPSHWLVRALVARAPAQLSSGIQLDSASIVEMAAAKDGQSTSTQPLRSSVEDTSSNEKLAGR